MIVELARRVGSCGWVALRERRRTGFARLSGWQPVGNWVVSAREFSSIPVTRGRYPDNEQKNRDARFAPKNGQKPRGAVTRPITGRQKPSPAAGVVFYRVLRGVRSTRGSLVQSFRRARRAGSVRRRDRLSAHRAANRTRLCRRSAVTRFLRHGCFTPETGHCSAWLARQKSANCRH
jgi:hypothetical protein